MTEVEIRADAEGYTLLIIRDGREVELPISDMEYEALFLLLNY